MDESSGIICQLNQGCLISRRDWLLAIAICLSSFFFDLLPVAVNSNYIYLLFYVVLCRLHTFIMLVAALCFFFFLLCSRCIIQQAVCMPTTFYVSFFYSLSTKFSELLCCCTLRFPFSFFSLFLVFSSRKLQNNKLPFYKYLVLAQVSLLLVAHLN